MSDSIKSENNHKSSENGHVDKDVANQIEQNNKKKDGEKIKTENNNETTNDTSSTSSSSSTTSTTSSSSIHPTDEQLEKRIREILLHANLEKTTFKIIRQQLESEFKAKLKLRKQFINETSKKIMQETIAKQEEEEEEKEKEKEKEKDNDNDNNNGDDDVTKEQQEEKDLELARELASGRPRRRAAEGSYKKAEKRKQKAKNADKKQKPKRPPKPMALSPNLSIFLGTDRMSRGEVSKALWKYIKDKNLQDPKDKRKILLDAKLQELFDGRKTVTMFSMNKYLAKHIKRPESICSDAEGEDD